MYLILDSEDLALLTVRLNEEGHSLVWISPQMIRELFTDPDLHGPRWSCRNLRRLLQLLKSHMGIRIKVSGTKSDLTDRLKDWHLIFVTKRAKGRIQSPLAALCDEWLNPSPSVCLQGPLKQPARGSCSWALGPAALSPLVALSPSGSPLSVQGMARSTSGGTAEPAHQPEPETAPEPASEPAPSLAQDSPSRRDFTPRQQARSPLWLFNQPHNPTWPIFARIAACYLRRSVTSHVIIRLSALERRLIQQNHLRVQLRVWCFQKQRWLAFNTTAFALSLKLSHRRVDGAEFVSRPQPAHNPLREACAGLGLLSADEVALPPPLDLSHDLLALPEGPAKLSVTAVHGLGAGSVAGSTRHHQVAFVLDTVVRDWKSPLPDLVALSGLSLFLPTIISRSAENLRATNPTSELRAELSLGPAACTADATQPLKLPLNYCLHSSLDAAWALPGDVLSLHCPLTQRRMVLPARGRCCPHIQAFDLCPWLKLCSLNSSQSWLCPLCAAPLTVYDLFIDVPLWHVLNSTPPSVKTVVLTENRKPTPRSRSS